MFPEPPAQSGHVLGLLQVIRDDFGHTSNTTAAIEKSAAAAHHQSDTEAAVSIAALEKDLEYAQTRVTELEAAMPQTNQSLNASLTELHNGEEMYAKLYDLCLKPETYEDRKAQRDEEKAALEMMESEALLQVGRKHHRHKNATNATNATPVAPKKAAPVKRTQKELDAAVLALFGAQTAGAHRSSLAVKRAALQQSPLAEAVARVVAILQSVQADILVDKATDEYTYQDMQTWCTENLAKARAFNADAQDRDNQLTLLIESTTAEVARLEVEVAKLAEEISAARQALAQATKLREQEAADFHEEEKKYIESITALQGAILVLGRHQQFGNGTNRTAEEVESDYDATLSLGSVKTHVQKMLRDFPGAVSAVEASAVMTALSRQEPKAEEAAYESPTGEWCDAPESIKSYDSQSGVVFGILNQLLATFQQDLSDAQEKESNAKALYADVKTSKEEEIATMLANEAQKSSNLAQGRMIAASSKEELEDLRTSLSSGYELVQSVTTQCNDFDLAYAERVATRNAELTALNETIATLSSGNATTTLEAGETAPAALVKAAPSSKRTKVPVAKAAPAAPTAAPAPAAVLGNFLKKY